MHTIGNLFKTGLYCLTAEKFSRGRSNIDVVREMLEAGVKIIQYREKNKDMRDKYEECLAIREMTRHAGACFIVNDDIHLAMVVDADGVHVGQEDLPVAAVRSLVGQERIIGLSTHSPAQAREAVELGVDYIGVGPIYSTKTKDNVCDAVGLEFLTYVATSIDLPFVAIGGIKTGNVAEPVRHGATCVALVTEIVGARDIQNTIRKVRSAMLVTGE
ncbi:MAG TPA: thiamine phosphate synthase [Desulfomicrobiaceae bacterium]|nr:thiamine phosphate synthase [Desulfomicrobiaceae bacterium]